MDGHRIKFCTDYRWLVKEHQPEARVKEHQPQARHQSQARFWMVGERTPTTGKDGLNGLLIQKLFDPFKIYVFIRAEIFSIGWAVFHCVSLRYIFYGFNFIRPDK